MTTERDRGPSRWWAIRHMRCPRCREGRVYRSLWSMHERCPVCNLLFQRASGYFMGAMYFSYGIGIPIIASFTGIIYLIKPQWRLWQQILLAWVLFLPMVPWVFRISRVLWMHMDRYFDPEEEDDLSVR